MKLVAKHTELVQLIQKFVQRSHVVIFHNERTWSTPIAPKTHILVCFIVFGCIWDHFVSAWNSAQNGVNWFN